MTQQNAALVEQSAAAAESLREQAQRLAQVVGTFKLSNERAASAPRQDSPAPSPSRPRVASTPGRPSLARPASPSYPALK